MSDRRFGRCMWVTLTRPDRKTDVRTRRLISFVGTSLDGYP